MAKIKNYLHKDSAACIAAVLFVIAANAVIWAFTGNWPNIRNPYNSFALQAEAWIGGRLDLGQNYYHLELAVFEGRYYVSFPPLLSIILLPFVLLFGTNTPDHFIALSFACAAAVYAYKLIRSFTEDRCKALFYTLFLCVGSNLLFLTNNGYVWFIAQTAAFSFTLAAFYYAAGGAKARAVPALLLLCCAMGCRPFNAVYVPLIVYMLYERSGEKGAGFLIPLIKSSVPAVLLGCVYMGLNYARFGNVLEFGHNYLPEFTEAEHGQFSAVYFLENFKTLWRLPAINGGKIVFQKFNGTAFWLVSPIIITYAAVYIKSAVQKKPAGYKAAAFVPLFAAVHIAALCMHKTMGGWHFGHRYTVDVLPAVFLGLAALDGGGNRTAAALSAPLMVLGLVLNTVGTIFLYNGYL